MENYLDEPLPQQKVKLGQLIGKQAMGFVSTLINAKESGKKLPKALDAVAKLGIKARDEGVTAAKSQAKEEGAKKIGTILIDNWLLVVIALIIVIVLIFRK